MKIRFISCDGQTITKRLEPKSMGLPSSLQLSWKRTCGDFKRLFLKVVSIKMSWAPLSSKVVQQRAESWGKPWKNTADWVAEEFWTERGKPKSEKPKENAELDQADSGKTKSVKPMGGSKDEDRRRKSEIDRPESGTPKAGPKCENRRNSWEVMVRNRKNWKGHKEDRQRCWTW